MTATAFLDALVSRAKMQEQINGATWGVIAAWLEEHRVMLSRVPSTNTNSRKQRGGDASGQ